MTTDVVGWPKSATGLAETNFRRGRSYTWGMPTEDDPPSGTMTTAEHLALNRKLFAERNRLAVRERKLAAEHEERQTPESEKELRRTQHLLERVTGKIVEANMGLVVKRVSRFTKRATPERRDEYMAAGRAGLVEAIDSYDVAYDNFAAWAMWPIMGAVREAVRQNERQTQSARDFAKSPAVWEAVAQMEQATGGSTPSIEDVAARAGVSAAQAQRILFPTSTEGIDETWGKELSAKRSVSEWDDPFPDVHQFLVDDAWEGRLFELLQVANIRDVMVFGLRRMLPQDYGFPVPSYDKIAERLGISRETARKGEQNVVDAILAQGWEIPRELR